MKFIVTEELGKLCKWLRILGFDTKYFEHSSTSSVVVEALKEERVLLTKRTRLGKHPGIKTLIIKFDNLKNQLKQVYDTYSLPIKKERVFSRCLRCNKKLSLRPKEKVKSEVPEYVYNTHRRFMQCDRCNKIYWKGSHWRSVKKFLNNWNIF